jgi:hypothetical protein
MISKFCVIIRITLCKLKFIEKGGFASLQVKHVVLYSKHVNLKRTKILRVNYVFIIFGAFLIHALLTFKTKKRYSILRNCVKCLHNVAGCLHKLISI